LLEIFVWQRKPSEIYYISWWYWRGCYLLSQMHFMFCIFVLLAVESITCSASRDMSYLAQLNCCVNHCSCHPIGPFVGTKQIVPHSLPWWSC
jgi:hypothetical protein